MKNLNVRIIKKTVSIKQQLTNSNKIIFAFTNLQIRFVQLMIHKTKLELNFNTIDRRYIVNVEC